MMDGAKESKFRKAAAHQVQQLGREIDTLATENSQLRAQVNRLKAAAGAAAAATPLTDSTRSADTKSSPLLDTFLIAGDRTISPTPIASLPLGNSNPLCIEAHSTHSNYICIGSADKHVTLFDWKVDGGQEPSQVSRVETSSPVLSVRFFPAHTHLVLASGMDGSCHLIDFKLKQVVLKWRDHDSYVLDTRTALLNGKTKTGSGKNETTSLRCVTVSRDKSCIVSSLVRTEKAENTEQTEKVLGTTHSSPFWTRTKLRSFYFQNVVESVAFVSPTLMNCEEDLIVAERNNNNLIYCNIHNNTKRLYNMNEKQDDHVSFNVLRLEVSPSGRHVLVATDAHRLFVIGNGKILRNFYGHTADEMSTPRIGWDTNEKYIVSNSQKDCDVHVWNIASERTEIQLTGHGRSVRDVSIVGNQLFTVSYDKMLHIWSLGGEEEQKVVETREDTGSRETSGEEKSSPTAPVSAQKAKLTTMEECDVQLKSLNAELVVLSQNVQSMQPTDVNRASLKKRSRGVRKHIKELTRKRKEIKKRTETSTAKEENQSMLTDPYVTTIVEDPKHIDVQV